MNIVLIGPAYPIRGGNALFVAYLYEALSREHTVEVISFSRLYPAMLFPGVRQNDISAVAIKKHPARHLIDSINPLTWRRAARAVADASPDLVIITWWNPFFGVLVNRVVSHIKKRIKVPVVIIAENVISHEGRRFDLALTKYALRTADFFVVLSGIVEKNIRRLFPDTKVFRSSLPVYDCYQVGEELSIEQARASLNITAKKVVLFFGYVRKYKGLMDLIEAFAVVSREVIDAHLLIVGEFYDDPGPYHGAIDRLGIREKVTIVPEYVPNESVGLYYSAADVVVLPYHTATQSGILSIAYGFLKPVVVTDVGGLAELVDHERTGYIVPPENVQALSGSIVRFFKEGRAAEFKTNIQRKTTENSFANMNQIFNDISRIGR